MGSALLPTNYHAEVGELPVSDLIENRVQCSESPLLLTRGEMRRELDLTPVADSTHASGRDDGTVDDLCLLRSASDRVDVVVVPSRSLDEVEHRLVYVSELVARGIGTALHLVPDHGVAK